jgi:hypothetical protein
MDGEGPGLLAACERAAPDHVWSALACRAARSVAASVQPRRRSLPSTLGFLARHARMDQQEKADSREPTLRTESAENADPAEPADPRERTDPAEPIDKMDPAEPIDKMDPAEPIDRMDPLEPMLRTESAEPIDCDRHFLVRTPAFSRAGLGGASARVWWSEELPRAPWKSRPRGASGQWNRDPVRRRRTGVKPLVMVLALLLAAGCSSGSQSPSRGSQTSLYPHGAAKQPAANLHITPRGAAPPPMSARLVLASRTMTAGSSMSARVVVENNTGHAVHVSGCQAIFQVVLINSKYHPLVPWLACLQRFTIPVGQSSYSASVEASYNMCTAGRPHNGERACLPNRQPPPLPPGTYHATLFQLSHIVPAPPTVTVRVTPPKPMP